MTEGSVQETGAGGVGGAGEPSQVEGAQQQQASEAPPDPRVMQHLEQLGSQIGQMTEQFGPVIEHFQQQAQPEADPFAEFGGEEFASQLGEQMGMDPQQLRDTLGSMIDSRAQELIGQHVAPIAEHLRIEGFKQLEGQYADMRDPQKAEQIWNSAESRAAEIAHNAGLPAQLAPAMMTPQFVELVYKAEMADQHAAAQSAAGEQQQQEVQLEGSSGGGPSQSGEQSLAERLHAARPGGQTASGFRFY